MSSDTDSSDDGSRFLEYIPPFRVRAAAAAAAAAPAIQRDKKSRKYCAFLGCQVPVVATVQVKAAR
jgi:hypothetical protein